MKRSIIVVCMALMMTAQAVWGQQQTISVAEGASVTVDLPFEAVRFDVTDRDVLSVNLLGERRAALQGIRAGSATATFLGADDQNAVYDVRVHTDVAELLAAMRIALEDVPEVEMVRAGDRIVVRGRVSSLANWNQLQTVVNAFGPQIMNLATLEMPPEILVNLRDGLRKAGFEIADGADEVGDESPGVLFISGAGRTVYVEGAVYSPQQLDQIKRIVESQRWLTVQQDGETDDMMSYAAGINVSVVPLIIEVDLAFISITDEEHTKIGVNLFEAGLLTIDAAGAFVGDVSSAVARESGSRTVDGVRSRRPSVRTSERTREYGRSRTYSVLSDLSGTLDFFTRESPDRVIHRGQLHFRNGAEEWRKLHSGGTLQLRLTSERETSIEEIDYGFILKVKGGLKDQDATQLDLEFELSTPTQIADTLDYDLQRERVNTSIDCSIGHTMVLGGVNSLLDSVDHRGTPILRSIPLMRTFFSERTSARTDSRMLVLVSPHIASDIGPSTPLSDQNIEVLEASEEPAEERTQRRRRRFFFF